MTRIMQVALGIAVLAATAGCGVLDLLLPSTTTVRLVNNGNFTVEGELFHGDEQFTIKELLKETGEELNFSIPSGETQTIIRDCDEIQAIFIDDARLQALLLTPDDDTELLQDGTDFDCGDTITYTFTHSAILTDFEISTAVTTPTFE